MPEVSHRNSLQPGYKLNWYRIDKILGQGGFGITYLAYNANLDRMAAIKEYLPMGLAVREGDSSVHPLTDEHGKQFHLGLDRFLSEAKTLARFEHPNIVRVFDVFEANHTAYMVMSYEEGESLQDVLTRRKTLGEEELMAILNPILDGLEKVHETGFIHRDIKPANIYLRKADSSPVLLDFGSARQALGVLTKTLTTLVSPGYAPFEQYYSKSDAQGPWTDIYGLGATLYRAITGILPMDAMDRSHVILKGGRNTFVSTVEIGRGQYSERFLQAVDHAMQFKEKDRPQTIADWRKEFVHVKTPVAVAKPAKVVPESHQVTKEARVITFEPKPVPPRTPEPAEKSQRHLLPRPGRREMVIAVLCILIGSGWYFKADLHGLINHWQRGGEIQALLEKAQADLAALRLVDPPGENALHTYRKVLELEPQNAEARLGLQAITDRLVIMAQQAADAEKFTEAEKFLTEAAGVLPDAANIQLARSELNLRRIAQERTATEAKARENKAQAALKEAEAAAGKGDALVALTKLDQARTLGADTTAIATIRDNLRQRLETLAAAATEEAQQALKAKDTARAREALKHAKKLKAQADALTTP